ncbi:MAG: hypothetical protein HY327_06950 [Chloroflexi bacterium]|nr:hypothetical protein [Chloroflexota bacterium]
MATAFSVQDYYDLTRLLAEHPEWRAQLRQLVLSDELLTLPALVRELTEAQKRTEQRVEELAEAQVRTEQRVEELMEAQARTEQRVEELVEAQKRTEQRLDVLTLRVQELVNEMRMLTANVSLLTDAQKGLDDRVGEMMGDLLELRYREHAAGYFGSWVRRARAVLPVDLEENLERTLSHEEVLDILRLDLLVNGRWRAHPERESKGEAPEVWLVIEVAAVLNEGDVARVWRRATLLRRAGYRAVPIVAGKQITAEALASARAQTVGVVQDGQGVLADEALATWLT